MNWYYVNAAGQQAGPVDDAGLDALVASGKITPETFVWKEGMANWQAYREARASGLGTAGTAAAAAAKASGGGAAIATGIEEAVCAECHGVFPVNDTIRVGNARVCANCKPIFVQKMREGVNVEAGGALRYAGFWVRFGAVFVDGIILYVINMALNLAFGFGIRGAGANFVPGQGFSLMAAGLVLMQLVVGLSYEVFFIGKYGATPGKMASKIHVIVADGSKVSYVRALGRYFSKIVSYMICTIGFIMAGFDPEKRALHDRMCNTRVVFK